MTVLLILSYLSKIGLLKVICYQGVKGYGNHIPFDSAHYMRAKAWITLQGPVPRGMNRA